MTKTILVLFCFSVFITESMAQKRVALVVGNSEYDVQSLRNPVNDANDITVTLRSLGFEVALELNSTQEDMESAIQKFGGKLFGDSVGLFYYSGHGVQYDTHNYLIPIGAMSRISAAEHLRYKAVDIGYVFGVMKQAGNSLNIVILDACRINPFKGFSRSMERGLKRVSGPEGTIVAYSTSPGKIALDGNGRNSPYAKQLIKLMKEPNIPIEIMLKKVREGVKSNTKGKQSPWYEASIEGDFYFIKTLPNSKEDPVFPVNLYDIFIPVYHLLLAYKKMDNNLYTKTLTLEHRGAYMDKNKPDQIVSAKNKFNKRNSLDIEKLSVLYDLSYKVDVWRKGIWGEFAITVIHNNRMLSPRFIVEKEGDIFKVSGFNLQ